ncbi:MAG: NuoF family protein [Candidatus Bathyarchaeia archaeon]|jgi:bidirectional [NiFe] hydrogenase diaphorase subunit
MNGEDLTRIAEEERQIRKSQQHQIHVCVAAACLSAHSEALKEDFVKEIKRRGIEHQCKVKGVGCLGLCAQAPLVSVESEGILYHNVMPQDIPPIVDGLGKKPVKELQVSLDAPFFSCQHRVVLDNCGRVDPERIEDYISFGGYSALLKALNEMRPPEVIDQVTRSGLRGRGGAGYPTGLKWSIVSKAIGARKFVVCNADEGDPGAFMDRTILASDPHKILEGMTIAAYAVGATEGYIYVRAEYPLAIKRLKTAIHQAERLGILGKNILGTQFNFSIEIRLGAGAFVCGEETALIASIEGKRGTPRPRPPYPAEAGLWNFPTLINNVETYAHIPRIILEGGEWYSKLGTEKSKGTKMFALAGRVTNSGLIEVPMGIKLREIIFDIGGIPEGHRFKAVQTGGPSGGCVPEQYLDTPVDYESLAQLGSIMGSGGMIVMDETSCMVDVAKYFIEFCKSESCGKCIPCRVGTAQMHDILSKITNGTANMNDLSTLEELCDVVQNTSLCGLGQTAPNSILSTLRYFREEYITHIERKTCPAGVCKMQEEPVS